MKIYIATQNKKKIELVEKVFTQHFNLDDIVVEGLDLSSEVSATPHGDDNYIGARNRALNAKKAINVGDYYIGLETGMVERAGNIYEETWCVIVDRNGIEKSSYSSGNFVNPNLNPEYVVDEKTNSKVLKVKDTTGNLVDYSGIQEIREAEIENAIKIALIQFLK